MSTRLSDAFTDSNGTRLASHGMNVGGGWTETQGSWDVQSNQARMFTNAGDGQNVAQADAGIADATWSIDVTLPASGSYDAGFVFNYVDNNNYWLYTLTGPSSAGGYLYQRVSGTFTLRRIVSATLTAGGTYTISVVTSGDDVTPYVAGSPGTLWNASGRPNKTGTKGGPRVYGPSDSGSRLDNWLVYDGSPSPAGVPWVYGAASMRNSRKAAA